jgi:DNA-binding response OmpR family regulator
MVNQNRKILLIEDDLALGNSILELLIMSNFNVEWLKNGVEAINYLVKNTPDIIICDLMMPLMNGEELFLNLRKQNKYHSIPFIIITANIDVEQKFRQLENGVNDYILKPFKVKELILKINNILNFRGVL